MMTWEFYLGICVGMIAGVIIALIVQSLKAKIDRLEAIEEKTRKLK